MALQRSGLAVGDSHRERVVDNLSRTQIVQYAGASGDYNPLHTDDVYTREIAGYPGVFAHGMLTMGLVGKMLTNYVGDARLTKYGVRFKSQVWPGDTLDATATVTAIRAEPAEVDLDIVAVNQNGVEVLSGFPWQRGSDDRQDRRQHRRRDGRHRRWRHRADCGLRRRPAERADRGFAGHRRPRPYHRDQQRRRDDGVFCSTCSTPGGCAG